jgi:hypothetical protein
MGGVYTAAGCCETGPAQAEGDCEDEESCYGSCSLPASLPRRLRELRKRLVSDEPVAFFSGDFPRGAPVHVAVKVLAVSLFRRVPS